MKVNIKFKKLDPEAILPKQSHPGDAGMDLYANEGAILFAFATGQDRVNVKCGFAMEMPFGWEGQVRPRSGLASKYGITVINAPGTIDAGYRGEVSVPLVNLSDEDYVVHAGDRIAQMVIAQVPEVTIEEVDVLSDTQRGVVGFGSTGK